MAAYVNDRLPRRGLTTNQDAGALDGKKVTRAAIFAKRRLCSNKPDTTFGNVKADVLADKDPAFRRGNFCSVIRGSAWRG
jgi:hypothetical protein